MPAINLCGKDVFEDDEREERRIGFRMVYMPSDMLTKISMSGFSRVMMKVLLYIVGMTYGNDKYVTVRSIEEALQISYYIAYNRVVELEKLGIIKRFNWRKTNIGINEDVRQWQMPKENPKLFPTRRNPCMKLKKEDIYCIRKMLSDGKRPKEISAHFDVATYTILAIKYGRNWGWLK